jgi:hypothetical protein
MSLTSTIAYETTQQAKEFSFKGIGLMVAALIFGAVVGITIANNPTASEAPAVATTGMAFEDFIRLNTTSYEGLVPVAMATAVETQGVGDAFIDMNVTSYEGLAPVTAAEPQRVGQAFIDMNVASYEGLAPAVAAEPRSVGQAFFDMNVASYEGIVPTAAATVAQTQNVHGAFFDMNVTSYEGLVPVAATATHRAVDPSFLYWNIEAFNNLSPTEAEAVLRSLTAADRNLWGLNVTSYGYAANEYADPPSGPR